MVPAERHLCKRARKAELPLVNWRTGIRVLCGESAENAGNLTLAEPRDIPPASSTQCIEAAGSRELYGTRAIFPDIGEESKGVGWCNPVMRGNTIQARRIIRQKALEIVRDQRPGECSASQRELQGQVVRVTTSPPLLIIGVVDQALAVRARQCSGHLAAKEHRQMIRHLIGRRPDRLRAHVRGGEGGVTSSAIPSAVSARSACKNSRG